MLTFPSAPKFASIASAISSPARSSVAMLTVKKRRGVNVPPDCEWSVPCSCESTEDGGGCGADPWAELQNVSLEVNRFGPTSVALHVPNKTRAGQGPADPGKTFPKNQTQARRQ